MPTGAATGFTYPRVRYCSAVNTCNTPGGSAPDGEVEDYRIEIVNTATLGDRIWRDINADGIQDQANRTSKAFWSGCLAPATTHW